ncbi:MAG: TonB-dependent receptor plug domain-containing protein, partial [Gemmatimonadota bacterium]
MRPRQYLLGALLAILWMAPARADAQTGTIRGRVTNQAGPGGPIAGAMVSYGSHRAQTDADGRFILTGIPAGTDTLRARLIGYTPAGRTVTLGAGQTVDADIALIAQALSLAEIVVTGYGEQRAGNITGAVTQVSSEDFNTGRIISPEELIRSKVPGVQVVDNNEPGGGFSVRIRGATSINASSEPLFVIDGVPVGAGAGGGLSAGRNPLNFLNPNDIESITVLRDASASAIYGANAANGVVLIKTKSGRQGTQFEYSSSVSSSHVTKLPSMLNATQFRAAVTQYAPQNVLQLLNSTTDWFSQVDRTAFGQEHNLAVSGATDNTNWRLSGGFLNQDGIIKGTTTERVSIGVNFQQRLLKDRLDVRANLLGARNKDLFTPGGVLSNAAQMGPTQPILDPTTRTGYYDWPGNSIQSPDNPVALLNLATDRGITYRSIGSVQAGYRLPFLEGLRINGDLAYDVTRTDRQTFFPSVLHGQTKNGNGGSDYRANQSQSNTTATTYLNYSAPFKGLPGSIDVTGGYSYGWSH